MPDNPRQIKRRNHYVPASYLAAFTDNQRKGGSLWRYERGKQYGPANLTPKQVAFEPDLYIRDTVNGLDDAVERFFDTSIESPFATIRDRLIYGAAVGLYTTAASLDPAERRVVARFLAFQLLRTPVERDAMRWLGDLSSVRILRESLKDGSEIRQQLERHAGRSMTSDEIGALRHWQKHSPYMKAASKDWLPRTTRNAERFALLIEYLEWRVVRVPASVELVTCDMPLVCVRQRDNSGSFELGAAMANPDFQATFVLSPHHVLLLAHRISDETFLKSVLFAQSVRERTIAYSHRCVYTRSRDDSIAQILNSTKTPDYYIEFNGRVFPVGHPVEEIDLAARRDGVSELRFCYGSPPTGTRSP